MEFMNEYGLLVAVALPILVIVAINVLLAIGGERGTLLLPSLGAYPCVYAPGEHVTGRIESIVLAETPALASAQPQSPRVARPAVAPARVEGFDESQELLARKAA